MHKIKIVSLLIIILSITLALLFNTISKKNSANAISISMINEQKSYVQEISKSILYLYKNKRSSMKQLESDMGNFLFNMEHKKENSSEHEALVKLCHAFYGVSQKFKKELEISTAYNSITIDEIVNDIYKKNQNLIVAFDTFLTNKQKQYDETTEEYKNIEYILFVVVVLLLIYLFTQIREIIAFIQKFRTTSKSIIQKSTIKDLTPMQIHQNDEVLKEAGENFNQLVDKIDSSIAYAQESIGHTTTALEEIEQRIENLMTLISQMNDEKSDTCTQKEDVVIDSLETLMNLTDSLKDLHEDLNKLTSSK